MFQRLARLNETIMPSLDTVIARYCALVRPHVLVDPYFPGPDLGSKSLEVFFDS